MKLDNIIELLNCGHEIEFIHEGIKYSITQGKIESKKVFSFCEYGKQSTEADTVYELMDVRRNHHKLKDMLIVTDESNLWVY